MSDTEKLQKLRLARLIKILDKEDSSDLAYSDLVIEMIQYSEELEEVLKKAEKMASELSEGTKDLSERVKDVEDDVASQKKIDYATKSEIRDYATRNEIFNYIKNAIASIPKPRKIDENGIIKRATGEILDKTKVILKDWEDKKEEDLENVAGLAKEKVLNEIEIPSPDSAEDIRNKLEVLNDDERLAFSAIRESDTILKDIEDLKQKPNVIERVVEGGGGGSGLQRVNNKQGVHQIDFGTNLTVTNTVNGVVVDATGGGGGGSSEDLSSQIDQSTKTFTTTNTPVLLFKDGTPIIEGNGFTYSSPTITITGKAPQFTLFNLY